MENLLYNNIPILPKPLGSIYDMSGVINRFTSLGDNEGLLKFMVRSCKNKVVNYMDYYTHSNRIHVSIKWHDMYSIGIRSKQLASVSISPIMELKPHCVDSVLGNCIFSLADTVYLDTSIYQFYMSSCSDNLEKFILHYIVVSLCIRDVLIKNESYSSFLWYHSRDMLSGDLSKDRGYEYYHRILLVKCLCFPGTLNESDIKNYGWLIDSVTKMGIQEDNIFSSMKKIKDIVYGIRNEDDSDIHHNGHDNNDRAIDGHKKSSLDSSGDVSNYKLDKDSGNNYKEYGDVGDGISDGYGEGLDDEDYTKPNISDVVTDSVGDLGEVITNSDGDNKDNIYSGSDESENGNDYKHESKQDNDKSIGGGEEYVDRVNIDSINEDVQEHNKVDISDGDDYSVGKNIDYGGGYGHTSDIGGNLDYRTHDDKGIDEFDYSSIDDVTREIIEKSPIEMDSWFTMHGDKHNSRHHINHMNDENQDRNDLIDTELYSSLMTTSSDDDIKNYMYHSPNGLIWDTDYGFNNNRISQLEKLCSGFIQTIKSSRMSLIDEFGYMRNMTRGRIDISRVHKHFTTGTRSVFKNITNPNPSRTRIVILIDQSGSMANQIKTNNKLYAYSHDGDRIEYDNRTRTFYVNGEESERVREDEIEYYRRYNLAQEISYSFMEAFKDDPTCDVYIYGHSARNSETYIGRYKSHDDIVNMKPAGKNRDGYSIFHTWKISDIDYAENGGNPDDKCIMFVLSDGLPSAEVPGHFSKTGYVRHTVDRIQSMSNTRIKLVDISGKCEYPYDMYDYVYQDVDMSSIIQDMIDTIDPNSPMWMED